MPAREINALLSYPGAKWGLAPQIVSLMPPHRSYLEPFFGSGKERKTYAALLKTKRPG